mmetsp:Transcript_49661/g.99931  ORF Transcript_49661/g.99931 Transcript_49661/m.99931 type:complete len:268 (-) Transcript_49661:86-889(-)
MRTIEVVAATIALAAKGTLTTTAFPFLFFFKPQGTPHRLQAVTRSLRSAASTLLSLFRLLLATAPEKRHVVKLAAHALPLVRPHNHAPKAHELHRCAAVVAVQDEAKRLVASAARRRPRGGGEPRSQPSRRFRIRRRRLAIDLAFNLSTVPYTPCDHSDEHAEHYDQCDGDRGRSRFTASIVSRSLQCGGSFAASVVTSRPKRRQRCRMHRDGRRGKRRHRCRDTGRKHQHATCDAVTIRSMHYHGTVCHWIHPSKAERGDGKVQAS